MNSRNVLFTCVGFVLIACGCRNKVSDYEWRTMEVTASAFNTVAWQTDSLENIAAWGDTLRPGMRCIAVSRDLIAMGLDYNTPVKIDGLDGLYLVKDKMHPRWRNKIDIFMGKDVAAAREWGRKKLSIQFPVKRQPEPQDP